MYLHGVFLLSQCELTEEEASQRNYEQWRQLDDYYRDFS